MDTYAMGKRIRSVRIAMGMKVCELAKYVGINAVYITRIEKHGVLPSPLVILRISSVLKDISILQKYINIKYKYNEIQSIITLIKNIKLAEENSDPKAVHNTWSMARKNFLNIRCPNKIHFK